MCWHLEHVFAATLAAPRQARAFAVIELGQALAVPDVEVLEDAAVILSELGTNAIQAGSDTVVTTLYLHREMLRIALADHAPGWPTLQPRSTTRGHGRGLAIIQQLSSSWGAETTTAGKQVWAVLPVPHC